MYSLFKMGLKLASIVFLIFSFFLILYAWLLLQSLSSGNFFLMSEKIFTTLLIGILIFVIASLLSALLLSSNKN